MIAIVIEIVIELSDSSFTHGQHCDRANFYTWPYWLSAFICTGSTLVLIKKEHTNLKKGGEHKKRMSNAKTKTKVPIGHQRF